MSAVLTNSKNNRVNNNLQWCWLPKDTNQFKDVKLSPKENTWAKILNTDELSLDDDEEALLLCPCSNFEWVTWIPSRGETILKIDQFCLIPER